MTLVRDMSFRNIRSFKTDSYNAVAQNAVFQSAATHVVSKSSYPRASLVLLPCIGGLLVPIAPALAQVVSAEDGTGTMVDTMGDRIDISGGQTSSDNTNLFHSFEQFDLNTDQTASFITAPDIRNVVGRISGEQSSVIDGTLQVSGSEANLYLMNPAGILMGPNAQLNLSGGFTATTATGVGFDNGTFGLEGVAADNLNGEVNTFEFAIEQPGAVVNLADLEVERGESISLIGGSVVNTGSLKAPEGSITIAAVEGENAVRISQAEQLLSLEVTTNDTLHDSLTPASIGEMLTGTGVAHVNELVTHADGSVSLGYAQSAIDETGGNTSVSGTLSTNGETGGNINVLGSQVSLVDAQLEASGEFGGGQIRVGGDYQGNGNVFNAQRTTVDQATTISANATESGNGGTAIVWANDTTEFSGRVEARGGQQSGNGGFAEISGSNLLSFNGTADLSAQKGTQGTVLLDPQNWVITDGAAPADTGTTSYVSSSTIESWTGANYELMASDSIRIEDLSDNELKLREEVSLSLSAGTGSVTMVDAANDAIRAERGDITISGAGLFLGELNTGTDEHNNGGDSGIAGGNVTLASSQNVEVREIITAGHLTSTSHHSADGGDVLITAANGDINVETAIKTYSYVDGHESGSAGDITLRADNGSVLVSANSPTFDSVLLASAEASTHEAGDGGNISIIANNGGVNIAGNIASSSIANQRDGDGNSHSGNAGSIDITADGFISTGTILAHSTARDNGNLSGTGGSVTIASRNSGVRVGQIEAFSMALGDTSSAGGDVELRAKTGVQADGIDTSSRADSQSMNGGSVTIEAPERVFVPGQIETYSYARQGDGANDAGSVNIQSNNVETGLIEAWSLSRGESSGRGGDITISETGAGNDSSIRLTSGVQTFSRANDHFSGTGGSVELTADTVTIGMTSGISVEAVSSAERNPEDGGKLTINAGENLTVSGQIQTFSESRSGIDAGNGGDVGLAGDTVALNSIETWSRASSDPGTAGNVSINSIQSLSVQNIDATSANGNGDILLVGDNIEDFSELGTLLGGNLTIDSATEMGNVSLGGTITTADFDLLDSDLANLGSIDNLIIGRANGVGSVTLQPSLFTTTADRAPINIQGAGTLRAPDGTSNTFQITGLGEGSLLNADVAFSNIGNLYGGSGKDRFNFVNDGAIAGEVNGQGGYDTFDYSNSSNRPISINITSQSATNTGRFALIENIIGSSSNDDTIVGTTANDTFKVTGTYQGSVNDTLDFSGIENIQGGSLSNTVDYSGLDRDITIDLETGDVFGFSTFSGLGNIIGNPLNNNTIVGSAGNDIFELMGNRSGQVTSSGSSIAFSNIDILDGAGGENIFNLENLASASGIEVVGGSDLDNSQSNNRVIAATDNALWHITQRNRGLLDRSDGVRLVDFREIQHLENRAVDSTVNVKFTNPFSQITGSINSGDSDLTLIGNDINIGHGTGSGDNQNGSISGQGVLTILPEDSGAAITLGGVDNGEANRLNITAGELAAIQDGFEQIVVGGDTQTGEITLGGEARFRDSVELRSQGNINTAGGELSTADGDLQVVSSQGEVTTGNLRTANGNLSINAQQDVRTGTITTSGNSLDIVSSNGSITTAGITTAGVTTATAGSVDVTSPGSIVIEFIDAQGTHDNTVNPTVNIDSRDSVTLGGVTGTSDASITTAGSGSSGSIQILYGEENEPATNFSFVRSGKLVTNRQTLSSGSTSENLRLADISVTNRGVQPTPPSEPEVPEPEPSEPEKPELVFGQIDLMIQAESIDVSQKKREDLFVRLETAIGSEFGRYLNITEEAQTQTLPRAQQTLEEVEEKTGVQPALVYVYFVPDAATAESVEWTANRAPRPDDQLEVMLVSQRGEPIRQRQWGVTRSQVEATAYEFRSQVNNQFSTRKQYQTPAQQMYDWVMRPLINDIERQNIDSLGFVLDTGLRTMPLSAMHSGDRYLVEDYSLGLMPTFSLTNFEQNDIEQTSFQNASVLAMGASEFELQPDLPAVVEEIQLLSKGIWQGETFLNEAFVLENLQTQLQTNNYDVVHLATHATFESGDLNQSYIQLWREQLSLGKIDTLHLSEAEIRLIVLSACRTAMGDEASEYGFAGFAVNSGSPSALASLWSVSDEGTLGFMAQFYSHLQETPIRSDALRQAQIDLLSGEVGIEDGVVYGPSRTTITELPSLAISGQWDFSHPFYWSAFTMVGNPW